MWTESGSTQWYSCRSAYGSGFCLKPDTSSADETSYAATTSTVSAAPAGYSATSMPYDLATPTWGTTAEIPTPTWPASFYPGVTPISELAY